MPGTTPPALPGDRSAVWLARPEGRRATARAVLDLAAEIEGAAHGLAAELLVPEPKPEGMAAARARLRCLAQRLADGLGWQG